MMKPGLSLDDQKALIACAHAAADAARPPTLHHFRRAGLVADNKSAAGFDPVTQADRAAEQAMRQVIARLRPDDAVLGEEQAATPGTSGLTWVLDPIDGTRGYLAGTPTWGVLVAVSDTTGPLYGLIDQPFINERFEGGFGRATVTGPMGRIALASSDRQVLDQAILFSTFPEVGSADEAAAFRALSARVRLTRYGMDCYAYALVAAGSVDLVVEAGLQPYDVAAPIAVIRAAGGLVTDWTGGPAQDGGRVLAAANPVLHAQALAVLAAAL